MLLDYPSHYALRTALNISHLNDRVAARGDSLMILNLNNGKGYHDVRRKLTKVGTIFDKIKILFSSQYL